MREESKLSADGLEVVVQWFSDDDIARPVDYAKVADGEPLCRLTDAKRLLSQLREELEQRDAHIEALKAGMTGDYDLDAWLDWAVEAKALREELQTSNECLDMANEFSEKYKARLAALSPAGGGVVMPERMTIGAEASGFQNGKMVGWNACLDEVARLNPPPATADSDVREVGSER